MNRTVALAWVLFCTSSPIWAETNQDEISELREQIRLLTERIDHLESDRPPREVTAEPAHSGHGPDSEGLKSLVDQQVEARLSESWTERIAWKGDFRYRYENIGIEGVDDRNRQRIRARAQLEADIGDDTTVGLGIATGGFDPVSTNQTLGAGGSSKDINLNLAYFEWAGLRDTRILGGKFKNLLHRPGGNGLLWDSDWNPEGIGVSWDNGRFFATGLGTWVESDSNKLNQEFSYGVQAGFRVPFADSFELIAGIGYFKFDTAGNPSFFGDEDDFFGNSFDPQSLTYIYDYHEVEAFAELNFDFLGRPMSVFADYVVNTDADEDDSGYAFGVIHGAAKDPGSWEFGVTYEDLEADAVLGLLTDSDFGGGGTNAKGYILSGTYALRKNWNASVSYFINDIGINTGQPRDFDRLQLDLGFKYK